MTRNSFWPRLRAFLTGEPGASDQRYHALP